MCSPSECLQLTLNRATPCFTALGLLVCDLSVCAVSSFLEAKGIDPVSQARMDLHAIDHALHHVCPQSILNPNLPTELRNQIVAGLAASLNK